MTIIWTADADADRDRIWLFNADRSVERADRVDARLTQRLSMLIGVSGQGKPIGRSHRQLSIPDIQLVVRYRVDEDAVRIPRVWHTRENREGR